MKTLRSKLFWGLTFLFGVILVLGMTSSVLIYRVGSELMSITENNSKSLEYSVMMFKTMDDLQALHLRHLFFTSEDSLSEGAFRLERGALLEIFRMNLEAGKQNATEVGEKEQIEALQTGFENYLKMVTAISRNAARAPVTAYYQIHRQYEKVSALISEIYKTNMHSLRRKSENMERFAHQAIIGFFFICGVSLIVVTWFVTYFPRQVTQPFEELTQKIQAISERNLDQELQLTTSDEFRQLTAAFNRMVRRLKEYENSSVEQLLFEKKRMEAILDSLNDPVMVLDHHKKILSVNRTAQELLEVPSESLLGAYAPDVATRHDLVREMIRGIMPDTGGKAVQQKHPIKVTRDDQTVYYLAETVTIHSAQAAAEEQKVVGYLLILKNITLVEARHEEKRDFIAHISHELKTPISSINLSLKILEDQRVGELNKEQQDLLHSIRQQNRRLLRVVNEVTAFSQKQKRPTHHEMD